MNDLDAIRSLLKTINEAWLHGAPDQLAQALDDCIDEDMLIAGPNFQRLARGKQACIDSYADFMRQARIHTCTIGEPVVDLRGETAVATYGWDMTYEMNGRTYRESGHDLVVLQRRDGKWRMSWRAVVPKEE